MFIAEIMVFAIMTSTPCGLSANGCVDFPNGWLYPGTIQLKTKNPMIIQHEIGHYKYQKYFDINHPEYKNTTQFWNKQPNYWAENSVMPKDWQVRPWENMASWYASWKVGDEVPKEIVKWFKTH